VAIVAAMFHTATKIIILQKIPKTNTSKTTLYWGNNSSQTSPPCALPAKKNGWSTEKILQ
jgi:hypothetical protein